MNLTAKELAVMACMAQGMKPREAAQALGIGLGAYGHRRESILNKFGAFNDVQIGLAISTLPIGLRNRIQDRIDERVDARRTHGGRTLDQYLGNGAQ